MPELLKNQDRLEEFVTEHGCHIYNLLTDTTEVTLPPLVVKAVKEVVQKVVPRGTTLKKKSSRRILDSSSESETEDTPRAVKKVKFSSPLTEVKGTYVSF